MSRSTSIDDAMIRPSSSLPRSSRPRAQDPGTAREMLRAAVGEIETASGSAERSTETGVPNVAGLRAQDVACLDAARSRPAYARQSSSCGPSASRSAGSLSSVPITTKDRPSCSRRRSPEGPRGRHCSPRTRRTRRAMPRLRCGLLSKLGESLAGSRGVYRARKLLEQAIRCVPFLVLPIECAEGSRSPRECLGRERSRCRQRDSDQLLQCQSGLSTFEQEAPERHARELGLGRCRMS